MGKGNRNRQYRGTDIEMPGKKKAPKAPRAKAPMPVWLKRTIAIAVAVVLVLGIVAAIMASNGVFRRMQVLVKSKTGEFTVNRQVATFLAWELEYYYAYMSWLQTYYTNSKDDLFTVYNDPDNYAFDRATASIRQDVYDADGKLISTPRDIIDDTMSLLINHVAVSDYAYGELGLRLEKDEWKNDLTVTWLSGVEDKLPVTWNDLRKLQYEYGYSSMDLMLKQVFGGGLNTGDVEDALSLVCMYEKYLAIRTAEVEAGTQPEHIDEYIKNNPAYFYTTDYYTYQTTDAALKAKLEAVSDVAGFKAALTENWFDVEGNYKKYFNEVVTGGAAEKDYISIEGKTGADLETALEEIGATQTVYLKADASNTEKIDASVSKWAFDTSLEKDKTTIISGADGFYLLAFVSKNYDANNALESVTVMQKFYESIEGDTYLDDPEFKSNVLKQLLIDMEISDEEAPAVNYQKALDRANAFKDVWMEYDLEDMLKALKENADSAVTRVEDGVTGDDDVDDVILNAIFGGEQKPTAETFIVAEDDDIAYLICIESINAEDDTKVTYSFAEIKADPYYQILTELKVQAEKNLPTEKSQTYASDAQEGTYQHWMFNGANAENQYKSPVDAGDIKVISTTKTENDKEVTTYDIYIVSRELHLDDEILVNGGYYVYPNTDGKENEYLEGLKGKTGDELIAALQAIGVSSESTSKNSATVSEYIYRDDLDEKLGDWLFDDARVANDCAVVKGDDNKIYIAVYLSDTIAWKVAGKNYYVSDVINKWMEGLAADYTPNERVLDRIGEPTPPATAAA